MIAEGTEIDVCEAGGVAVKQIHCPEQGSVIWQHVHTYDHLSLLARGSVEVWIDGELTGQKHAPDHMEIKAGVAHKFVTLTPDTLIYCVHNLALGPIGYTLNPEVQ
jgi:quercetin dioxygenase-like cupin family protein